MLFYIYYLKRNIISFTTSDVVLFSKNDNTYCYNVKSQYAPYYN